MNITSCKMYRQSRHKDSILSAITNPINVELVQQLADQLDDEYLRSLYPEQSMESEVGSDAEFSSEGEFEDEFHNEKDVTTDIPTSQPSPTPSVDRPNFVSYTDTEQSTPDEEESSDMEEDHSESTEVSSTTDAKDTLKSILCNSTSSLPVLGRMYEKNNELWLHYKDNVNLNNVMDDIIDVVEASESYRFNRLARSDNSLVFDIVGEGIDRYRTSDN